MDWTISLGLTLIIFVLFAGLVVWISPYLTPRRKEEHHLGVVIVRDDHPEPRSYTEVVQLFKEMNKMGFTYVSGSFTTLYFFNYHTEMSRRYEVQKQTNGEINRIWTLAKEEQGTREDIPVLPNPQEDSRL